MSLKMPDLPDIPDLPDRRDKDERKGVAWLATSKTVNESQGDQGKDFYIDRPGYNADHWMLFCGIFLFASLGGLAALLRSGQQITATQVLSAFLNSGIMGFIVATILWSRFAGEDIYLLIGISVMAGFGGSTIIDFSFKILEHKILKFFGIKED